MQPRPVVVVDGVVVVVVDVVVEVVDVVVVVVGVVDVVVITSDNNETKTRDQNDIIIRLYDGHNSWTRVQVQELMTRQSHRQVHAMINLRIKFQLLCFKYESNNEESQSVVVDVVVGVVVVDELSVVVAATDQANKQ